MQKRMSKEDSKKEQVLSGGYEDDVYSTDYEKMGKCIIFNHKTYTCGQKDRPDTDIDAGDLERFFESYKFAVKVYNDRKVDEIKRILARTQMENHSNASCFVLCVLTHGDLSKVTNEEILYAEDSSYPTESLFSPFLGDSCKSLAGKPKLFFIQACRGGNYDSGINIFFQLLTRTVTSLMNMNQLYSQMFPNSSYISEPVMRCKIPLHADYFVAYSTVRGNASWKREQQGSWFIQALCNTLKEKANNLDLASILTIVCRKVAYGCESNTTDDKNKMKQVPSIYTTLTRRFEFPKARNSAAGSNH